MQELRLVTAIEDGTKLHLRAPDGSEYSLPVDEKLKAALRGDRVRLGQIEIEMDTPLRPRDIQARIRAGESAEQVAAAAGIPLERVRRYEGPVLAERDHMASMARRTTVRGPVLGDGPAPLLGDIVAQRLRDRGIDADTAAWDSWRRDDGRWQVVVTYRRPRRASEPGEDGDGRPGGSAGSAASSGAEVRSIHGGVPDGAGSNEGPERALFVFDPARRAVVPDDDSARALIAEQRSRTAEAVVALIPRMTGGGDTDPVVPGLEDSSGDVDGTSALDRPGMASSGRSGSGRATPRVGVPAMGGLIPLAPVPPRRPRDEPPPDEHHRSGKRRAHVPASATAPIRRPSAYDERLLGSSDRSDRSAARDGVRPGKRATVPTWDEILFGTRTRNPE